MQSAISESRQYKLAPTYQERIIPYLKEMTERQISKGLIRWIHPFEHFYVKVTNLFTRGDERVSEFRDLIIPGKGHTLGRGEDSVEGISQGTPPSTQTSLRQPTESDLAREKLAA